MTDRNIVSELKRERRVRKFWRPLGNVLRWVGVIYIIIAFLVGSYEIGVWVIDAINMIPWHFPALAMMVGSAGALSTWVTTWA